MTVTEVARAAATWWADLLARGVPPSLRRDAGWVERGDPSSALRADFGDLMTGMLVARSAPLVPAHVDAFRGHLTNILVELFGRFTEPGSQTNLATDYGPDRALANALELAGVPGPLDIRLPYKTRMRVGEHLISVSCGYGAPLEVLYQTKARAIVDALDERETDRWAEASNAAGDNESPEAYEARRAPERERASRLREVCGILYEQERIPGYFDRLVEHFDKYIVEGGTKP